MVDRYAFVYTPTSTGILRTVEQPMGGFTSLKSGISGRANFFQNKLQISGRVNLAYCHNGRPFYSDKTYVNYVLKAFWYFGNWNVGAQYYSENSRAQDAVDGVWTKHKQIYNISAGWGNATWNISAQIANPFSWSWVNSYNTISSKHFDRQQTTYGPDSHCYVKLGVTYVFGFGKQVRQGDEASQQYGAGSAILE